MPRPTASPAKNRRAARLSRAVSMSLEQFEERILFGDVWSVHAGDDQCPDCFLTLSGGAGPAGDGHGTPVYLPTGGNPAQASTTEAPVRYHDGAAKIQVTDLQSDGFGSPFGISRSYSNRSMTAWQSAKTSTNTTGNRWHLTQIPQLISTHDASYWHRLMMLRTATDQRYFEDDRNDGGNNVYISLAVTSDSIVRDPASLYGDFTYVDEHGNTLVFSNPVVDGGRLKSFTRPDGSSTTYTYEASSPFRVTEIATSKLVGPDTVKEAYSFSYPPGNVPYDTNFVASITLTRTVNAGAASTLRSVEYAYYDGTTADGALGDLKTATVKDGSNNVLSVSYYRYAVESATSSIGLKYVFSDASFDRLDAAMTALGTTPFAATDAQVAPYADNYFEYDSGRRVTKEIAGGTGCSACTAGLGAYESVTSTTSTSGATPIPGSTGRR